MKILFASTLLTIALVFFANGTNEMIQNDVSNGTLPFAAGLLMMVQGVITLRKPKGERIKF